MQVEWYNLPPVKGLPCLQHEPLWEPLLTLVMQTAAALVCFSDRPGLHASDPDATGTTCMLCSVQLCGKCRLKLLASYLLPSHDPDAVVSCRMYPGCNPLHVASSSVPTFHDLQTFQSDNSGGGSSQQANKPAGSCAPSGSTPQVGATQCLPLQCQPSFIQPLC